MQSKDLLLPHILSADVGGSHITAAIYNANMNLIDKHSFVRQEVNGQGTAIEILACWTNALQESLQKGQGPVSGVAIAMPGPFNYKNGISYIKGLNKYDALYGMDIKNYLAASLRLPLSSIKFRNDAESTIAGEIAAGAGRRDKKVLGITLGTGFGSAYSDSGFTSDINLGSAMFLDSIADDHLSTRWFLKRYFELTGNHIRGVKELAFLAPESKLVRNIFKEFAVNMGDFLSPQLNKMNPDVLIICGNISRASDLFVPHLKTLLKSTVIRVAELGEQAALIGAAELFHPRPELTAS